MSGRRSTFNSLEAALSTFGIPPTNYEFIAQACRAVGAIAYEGTDSYIVAIRGDEGPPLRIHFGWTNGFRSQDEARSAGDATEPWPSKVRPGLWGVTHPVNRVGHGGGGETDKVRNYGVCATCFLTLPATGLCGSCA